VDAAFDAIRDRVARPAAVLTTQEMFLTQAATLADRFGVLKDSVAVVTTTRDKARMKAVWAAAEVRTARSGFYRTAAEVRPRSGELAYPVIVKPSLGYASVGVKLVASEDDLVAHLRQVSLVNSTVVAKERLADVGLLVEEYLDGEEYSVDTVWFDGRPMCDGVLSKGVPQGPYFPDRLYHLDPELDDERRKQVVALSHEAVTAVGVRHGATHTEIRFRDGEPFVLETTNRPGAGGVFHLLFRYATGVDFARAYYASLVSEDLAEFVAVAGQPAPGRPDPDGHYFWYNVPPPGTGVIREIHGLRELRSRPGVLLGLCYKKPGGALYGEGLESDYFCSVVGRADPAAGTPIEDHVRQFDSALEVIF
jgi:biotin carboxylase